MPFRTIRSSADQPNTRLSAIKRRLGAGCLLILLAGGALDLQAQPTTPATPAAYPSQDALVQEARDALKRKDRTRLDTLRHRESAFDALVASGLPASQAPAMAERARTALMGARSTAIFHAQFGRLFSRARVIDELPDEVIALNVDRTQGHFRVAAAVLAHSACSDLDGVEGDDLVLVLALRPTAEAPTQHINGRFATQQALHDCLAGWQWAWPRTATPFSERFRPGMYLVPGGPADAQAPAGELVAQACATAYFFYCWLVCQRIERNLLAVSVNGDWDEEFRRLLLVRKQVVAARK